MICCDSGINCVTTFLFLNQSYFIMGGLSAHFQVCCLDYIVKTFLCGTHNGSLPHRRICQAATNASTDDFFNTDLESGLSIPLCICLADADLRSV